MPQNANQIQLDFLQESQHWWFWQVLLKGILRGIWQESDRFLKHNNSWPISLHRMISGENDPSPPQPTHLHCSFLPQVRQCLGARKCSRSTTTSYLCHPQCFVEFDGFLQAEKKTMATLRYKLRCRLLPSLRTSLLGGSYRTSTTCKIRSEQTRSWSLPTRLEICLQFNTSVHAFQTPSIRARDPKQCAVRILKGKAERWKGPKII